MITLDVSKSNSDLCREFLRKMEHKLLCLSVFYSVFKGKNKLNIMNRKQHRTVAVKESDNYERSNEPDWTSCPGNMSGRLRHRNLFTSM